MANTLTIASTTSLQNSGLFDLLIPAYEKTSPFCVKIRVIAVGTGRAIRIAKKGEADLLFIHDPFREEKFVASGYGVNRRAVMHNSFVIVGPEDDPAGIRNTKSASEAFEQIACTGSAFVSRGDDSGTNMKELDIWEDIGVNPRGKGWYFETGSGMADTLIAADRKAAYCLTDIGTYMYLKEHLSIQILFQGDALLKNQYSVIAVNPARFPHVRYREAMDFIAFVTSLEGQRLIGEYEKYGIKLFHPETVPD